MRGCLPKHADLGRIGNIPASARDEEHSMAGIRWARPVARPKKTGQSSGCLIAREVDPRRGARAQCDCGAHVVVDLVLVRAGQVDVTELEIRAVDDVRRGAGAQDRVPVRSAGRDHRRIGDRQPVDPIPGQGVGHRGDRPPEQRRLDVLLPQRAVGEDAVHHEAQREKSARVSRAWSSQVW